MKPIVVVGSINMDLVSVTARAPLPGETVLGSDFQLHSGGKGANQAVAVARLGYPSILLGKVGDDIFGSQLLETLTQYGVDIRGVDRIPGASGTATIVVDGKGENSIVVTPGANREVTPEFVESKRHILAQAGMVLAQLEIPIATVARLAQVCEELNIPLMLDPAPAQALDATTLGRVTWLTPNEAEAQFYAENAAQRTPDAILGRLFEQGVRNVILKQGSRGALVAVGDGSRHAISSFAVDAVDTTAAGDAFNGAFAVALMHGCNVGDSAQFAAAAAAISVTRKGAQPSLATREEVDYMLEGVPR